jgi:hypothetical protein
MLTKTLRFDDDVVVVLRNQVSWSADGLRAEMPQLDAKTYQKVKKAFEAMAGKWSRREKATIFTEDPRPLVEGLITHGVLSVARDGFFRTPKEVVWRMLEFVPLGDCAYNTLEPEAGDGAIVEELLNAGILRERLYCIEQNPKRCQIVGESWPGVRVACGDFLKFRNSAHLPFHRIFMNPPFEEGQDGEHVRRAYNLLSSGGKMAAILGEGIFFRDDRKSQTFRAWMKAVGAYAERLPEGSFRQSRTNVNTRLLIVEK